MTLGSPSPSQRCEREGAIEALVEGAVKAELGRYEGAIKALLRGSMRALVRL